MNVMRTQKKKLKLNFKKKKPSNKNVFYVFFNQFHFKKKINKGHNIFWKVWNVCVP
jgi:hypothetical protein